MLVSKFSESVLQRRFGDDLVSFSKEFLPRPPLMRNFTITLIFQKDREVKSMMCTSKRSLIFSISHYKFFYWRTKIFSEGAKPKSALSWMEKDHQWGEIDLNVGTTRREWRRRTTRRWCERFVEGILQTKLESIEKLTTGWIRLVEIMSKTG